MENNWIIFFKDLISDLEVGSGWTLVNDAIEYLKTNTAKNIFEGIDESTRSVFFNNLLQSLEGISRNYRAILDLYMKPDRHVNIEKSFSRCTSSLYVVFMQAIVGYRLFFDSTFKALSNRGTNLVGLDDVEDKLVGFYADRAMIDFDENLSYEDKIDCKMKVEKEINELRNTLFSWLVSRSLIEEDKEKITSIVLSANIDTATKQLLVSALTLSCIEFFEFAKFSALLKIFNKTEDGTVKIKALIGVMLCLQYIPKIYASQAKRMLKKVSRENPAFMTLILNACKVELHARNMKEGKAAFSKQLFTSLLESTKTLLNRDSEEDEFLDEEDELSNDELSNSMIEDLFDMMEGGTDVYFTQFKDKKRTAFFHSMYNWFMPFSNDSVTYLQLLKKVGKKYENLLSTFLAKSHLCDSDRYSFASILGESKMDLSEAFDHVKEHNSDILQESEEDESLLEEDNNGKDVNSDAEMSRESESKKNFQQIIYYLHNLSRFYELAPMRSSFSNPFEEDNKGCFRMPLASDLFDDPYFTKYRVRMARFCLNKKKEYYIPALLMKDYPDTVECHFMLASAHYELYEQKLGRCEDAFLHVEWLMEHEPDNYLFCTLAANVYVTSGLYNKAEVCWKRAHAVSNDEERKMLAKSMLANLYLSLHQYEKATKLYYELNYKDPANPRYITYLVTSLILEHPGDKATAKRALEMLRSYAEYHKEPDPFTRLFNDKKALAEDDFAKSFSKFLGSMSEYMQQDHSMDCELRFLEGICMWVLINDQDETEERYGLQEVVTYIYDQYHDNMLLFYDHSIVDRYETAFEEEFTSWLHSFGISDIDMSIANEIMRKRYNKTQEETQKMLEDFKNGNFK